MFYCFLLKFTIGSLLANSNWYQAGVFCRVEIRFHKCFRPWSLVFLQLCFKGWSEAKIGLWGMRSGGVWLAIFFQLTLGCAVVWKIRYNWRVWSEFSRAWFWLNSNSSGNGSSCSCVTVYITVLVDNAFELLGSKSDCCELFCSTWREILMQWISIWENLASAFKTSHC